MDLYEEYFQKIDDDDINVENAIQLKKQLFDQIDEVPCTHENKTLVENSFICTECGIVVDNEELDEEIYTNTERYDSKDPARCHRRKSDQRTIFKDVEGMGFPEIIINTANKKYQKIIQNNIYRGSKRKAIIVVCIYHSYVENGEYRTSDEIGKLFNIKKKSLKEGFDKYYEFFPEAATQYIDAKHLIRPIMIKANINFSHLRRINRLCDFLENRSPLLNRSNPQSVAAAIVYLYLCLEPEYKKQLGMSKTKFADIVNLSDITITKLGKESQKIIQNTEIKI